MSKLMDLENETGGTFDYGTMVALVKIRTGFRTFTAGVPQAENWHDDEGTTEARKQAKAKAEQINLTNGKEPDKAKPSAAVALIAVKGKAYRNGEPMPLNHDLILSYEMWTDGYKQVLGPSLHKFNLDQGQEVWMRLGEVKDPRGGKRKGKNGKTYDATVHYVMEVFNTESDAMEAVKQDKAKAMGDTAASNGTAQTSYAYPPDETQGGYSRAQWDAKVPQIKEKLASGQAVPKLASYYGVDEALIEQFVTETPLPF